MQMRERPWFPMHLEPDPAASSFVEGWYHTPDGDVAIERLFHFWELGWTIESAEAAKLEGWRYAGPWLPEADEQAQTYCLWAWPRVPGELASKLPRTETFPWVLLVPGACKERIRPLTVGALEVPYEDGRTIYGLRRELWLT